MNSIYKVYYNDDLWRYINTFNICPVCKKKYIYESWDIFKVNNCKICIEEVLERSWLDYYGGCIYELD